jgi:hypothetical protein
MTSTTGNGPRSRWRNEQRGSSVQPETMHDLIGDIHGHADAFRRLLDTLAYCVHGGIYRIPKITTSGCDVALRIENPRPGGV